MANSSLRQYALLNNVRLWQVAAKLGIQDSNLSRKLRFELKETEAEKFRKAVDEIVLERKDG